MDLDDLIRSAMKESIFDAFSTVLSTKPTLVEWDPEKAHEYDLLCSIGFAGRLEGNVVSLFKKEDAMVVVAKMLDLKVTEVTQDVVDGIGEILNIVTGGIKNRVCETEYKFEINTPTVVNGQELSVIVSNDVKIHKVMVYFDNFAFGVIFSYKIHNEQEVSKFAQRKAALKSDALLKQLLSQSQSQEEKK